VDRSAIFVDAGYLLAEAGELVCGSGSRTAFTCDYEGLTTELSDWVKGHNGSRLHCLRTYWYDGAVDAVPTADHERIGGLPYVKVRLGRLIHGEQKGVDALIYRDLMTLARERAIACAYLVSGDEDLREGVVSAQDMGVQVVLLGVSSGRAGQSASQSAALIREADEHIVLPKSHWEKHFKAKTRDGSAPPFTPTPEAAEATGAAFAHAWAENATGEDLDELLVDEPDIPSGLDSKLLAEAEKTVGSLRGNQVLRRALRAGFWDEIHAAKSALAQPLSSEPA